MRILGLSAGAILCLAAAQPAFAAQCATVVFSPGTVTLPNYDPINGGAVQSSFVATISRVQATTRSVRLIFNDAVGGEPVQVRPSTGTGGPLYEILDPSGINIAFGKYASVFAARNPTVPLPEGPSGDSVAVSYTVNILTNSGGRDFRNGHYGDNLSYSVACFQGSGSGQGGDTFVPGLALSATIPNLVSLTTASPATLDFQNFTTLTQQLDVGVKSTGPINVELQTDNDRKMVRMGSPAPVPLNSYIRYGIRLRGANVASDPYILSNAPRAGVGGTQWPLQLTLSAQPSGKVAGSYSDTITLTVTPGS